MITLLVDEGYAFDYVSILEVKIKLGGDSSNYYLQCLDHISQQIGSELVNEILNSKEYSNLFEANKNTFLAVDKAKKNLISAKEVDECNTVRFKHKKDLLDKFFKYSKQVEKKI